MNKTLKVYYERFLTYQSGQNSVINSSYYLPVSAITCLFLNFIVLGILKQIPDIYIITTINTIVCN